MSQFKNYSTIELEVTHPPNPIKKKKNLNFNSLINRTTNNPNPANT